MEVVLVNVATGERRTVRCARSCPLRYLQKRVCGAFGEDFPATKAEIAVGGSPLEAVRREALLGGGAHRNRLVHSDGRSLLARCA